VSGNPVQTSSSVPDGGHLQERHGRSAEAENRKDDDDERRRDDDLSRLVRFQTQV